MIMIVVVTGNTPKGQGPIPFCTKDAFIRTLKNEKKKRKAVIRRGGNEKHWINKCLICKKKKNLLNLFLEFFYSSVMMMISFLGDWVFEMKRILYKTSIVDFGVIWIQKKNQHIILSKFQMSRNFFIVESTVIK